MLAVVRPASAAEVSAVVKLAHAAQMPIVPIAGNTGLNGGTWPGTDRTQILLSVERLNRVREIKPDSRIIIAEAGSIVFNGAFVTLMSCFFLGATYVLKRSFDVAAMDSGDYWLRADPHERLL
ncbi:MAG: FAD-binding protein [Thiolinea sp.]